MKKLILVFVILMLPAIAWLMQPGYFPMHDDLQVMRQLEMNKCFEDWQIPCRWVPDMGYTYGYPLFNFYPPLPYYLGQGVHWVGFSYIDTVKVLGILVLVASAITMFLLAQEFFGPMGGMLASMAYLYAPYHSVDYYVRAAVNESWSLVFFPLIYWATYKLIKIPSLKHIPLVAVSVAGLMLSHNPMLMIFAPTYLAWIIFWWFKLRSLASFKYLFISAIWALGLAAFFTLPVLFEQQFAHVETLVIGYFNYLAHFLDLDRLFLHIYWGYGASGFGGYDMSFAVGYLQWIIPAIVMVCFIFVKKLRDQKFIPLLLCLLLLTLFMTHSKSTWIWQLIQPLEYLQFPWRFLTLVIFFASFISGAFVLLSKKPVPLLLCLILLLNANYFRPRDWWPQSTDRERFSGQPWQLQLTSGIFDYLPIWAKLPPAGPPVGDLVFLHGTGSYKTLEKKSNGQLYDVQSDTPATLIVQTFYFPGWKVWVDGKLVEIQPLRDPEVIGRIIFDVPAGSHQITAKFTDTPIRLLGNIFSLLSFGMLILVFIKVYLRKYDTKS